MRDDEKLKPPNEVRKSSCLQAVKITGLKLHDCLFSMHHCTCHRLFVFSPTHIADESTLLELLYSSLCLLHTYLNLPFSPPTNTHINFQTATTGCVSEEHRYRVIWQTLRVWILDLLIEVSFCFYCT